MGASVVSLQLPHDVLRPLTLPIPFTLPLREALIVTTPEITSIRDAGVDRVWICAVWIRVTIRVT